MCPLFHPFTIRTLICLVNFRVLYCLLQTAACIELEFYGCMKAAADWRSFAVDGVWAVEQSKSLNRKSPASAAPLQSLVEGTSTYSEPGELI